MAIYTILVSFWRSEWPFLADWQTFQLPFVDVASTRLFLFFIVDLFVFQSVLWLPVLIPINDSYLATLLIYQPWNGVTWSCKVLNFYWDLPVLKTLRTMFLCIGSLSLTGTIFTTLSIKLANPILASVLTPVVEIVFSYILQTTVMGDVSDGMFDQSVK
jgi:hypothetical protein